MPGEMIAYGAAALAVLNRILKSDTLAAVDRYVAGAIDHRNILAEIDRRRQQRCQELLSRTAQLVLEAGFAARSVDDAFVVGVLSQGSLVDDAELRERYARLFAAAADPARAGSIPLSFVSILAELTPIDVLLLQRTYDRMQAIDQAARDGGPDLFWSELVDGFALPDGFDAEVTQGNWLRLNLVGRPMELDAYEKTGTQAAYNFRFEREYLNLTSLSDEDFPIRLTTLGVRFLEACQPPKRRETP